MTRTERDAKITEMVQQRQQTLEAIGATFGITRERVRQIAARRGVCRGEHMNALSEDERASAVELFARGMPIAHVADYIGRSEHAVGNLLENAGLYERIDQRTPWSEAETDVIRGQYGKVTVRTIAQQLGRTRNEVIGKARRLNLREARAS